MEGRSLDVFERDAASDRGINEMKELIEIARYAPARDRYKVMILDEAHMLTAEASNALLKVLEEPPEYILFALATTEPNKILPTILSRCQHYQLSRISQREIEEHLAKITSAEGLRISPDGLALVATAADGSLRDAQSLLDKLVAFAGDDIDEATVVDLLGLVDRVLLFRAIDLIADQDVAGILGLVNEMVAQGVNLHQFTIDLLGHVRNLLVVRTVENPGEILHLPAGDLETLQQQADRFEVDDLDRAFSLLAGGEYRIKMAEQPRYHVEVILARLARMPHLRPIEDLLAALDGGESGSGAPPGDSGGRSASRGSAAGRSAAPAVAPRAEAAPAPPEPVEPPAAPVPSKPAPEPKAAEAAPPPMPEEPPLPPEPDAPLPPEPAHESLPAPEKATAPVEPEQAAASAKPEPADDAPASGLLARIQSKLAETHGLVAQSLGRTSSVEVKGEVLVFRFPATAALFAERFNDPDILTAFRAACEAALGRSVTPRIELDPNAKAHVPKPPPVNAVPTASAPPKTAAPAPPPAAAPAETDAPTAPPEMSAPAEPIAAAAPPAPVGPAATNGNGASAAADPPSGPRPASPELREAVENDPVVQDLLAELKGTVLSVEELE